VGGIGLDAMSYVTVFEITQQALPLWFPVAFVFFGIWGAVILSQTRNLGFATKAARGVVVLFACMWGSAAGYYFLHQRHDIQRYRSGNYKVVEGQVERYSWKGKTECFRVGGVEFCHGTANQVGWAPPFRLGPASWPVSLTPEGRAVRVAYYDEDEFHVILRLEVGGARKN
jgi:hypothetical protein